MTKFLVKCLIGLFAILQFSSCQHSSEKDLKQGTATLIGYRVAKHSHLYIRIDETGTIHDIGGLGGRREPTLSLGDKFPIQYYQNENNVIPHFDKYKYVKYPTNRRTRRVMLDNYKNYYHY